MATAAEKAAAKRSSMIAALAEFGVTDVTDAVSNEDIEVMLKDAKAAAKAAAKAGGPIVVKYLNHEGEVVSREFSEEVHGDGYADLAEEFKKTNATKIVK